MSPYERASANVATCCQHVSSAGTLAACGYSVRWPFLLAAILLFGGCGESDWGQVEGVVTLRGEPIGPGTLIFEPTSPELTRSGMGQFAEDGHYEIKSAGNEAGLPAGEYRVRIHAEAGEDFGEERVGPPPESAIPPQYLNYGAGLMATVEPGSNTINLELEQ